MKVRDILNVIPEFTKFNIIFDDGSSVKDYAWSDLFTYREHEVYFMTADGDNRITVTLK